jgi:hypothetical protein
MSVNLFGIKIDGVNDEEIEQQLHIYVNAMVEEYDNPLDYFSDCIKRSKNDEDIKLINQYCLNYLEISNDENIDIFVLDNINKDNLLFIEIFYKFLKDNNYYNKIAIFTKSINDIKNNDIKFDKLCFLLESNYLKKYLLIPFYSGKINERNGFFSLLINKDKINKYQNYDIEQDENIKKIINIFLSNEENMYIFIKYIHFLFNQNISYTQDFSSNNCSSPYFLNFLSNVFMYFYNKYYDESKNKKIIINKDFSFQLNNKDINDLINNTYCLMIKINFTALFKIYKINFNSKKIDNNNILNILNNEKTINNIYNFFINHIVYNKENINNDFIELVNKFIFRRILLSKKILQVPQEIMEFIVFDIINGDIKTNKHIQYSATKIINEIHYKYSYSYFNKYNEKNNNFINILFHSFVKYMNKVNYFYWLEKNILYKYHQELLDMIKFYCFKIKPNEQIIKDVSLLFHKISSELNNILNDINEISKIINETYSITFIIMKERYQIICMEYLKTIMTSIQTIYNLIYSPIMKVKEIKNEVIRSFTIFTYTFIKQYSNKNNLLFLRLNLNDTINDIKNELYKVIKLCSDNYNFNILLSENNNIQIIINSLCEIKMNDDEKYELLKKLELNEKNKNNDLDELPEEFLDPLLQIEIKEPVMIPDINNIFDRVSIMSHLYEKETNPYTRTVLTIDDFEKYNNTDNVKKIINEFKLKLDNYKNKKK